MILAIDVHYGHGAAVAGGVAFGGWSAVREDAVYRSVCQPVAAYEPGRFYLRELPCLMHLIREHALAPEAIVIDGFVYLDGRTVPGLGKHLFDRLEGRTPVIGVAKRRFATAPDAAQVYRGKSATPLYVTSAGMPPAAARARIVSMHGPYRIPTLLKRADQVSRTMD